MEIETREQAYKLINEFMMSDERDDLMYYIDSLIINTIEYKEELERQHNLVKDFCKMFKDDKEFNIVFYDLEDTFTDTYDGTFFSKDDYDILSNYVLMFLGSSEPTEKYDKYIEKYLKGEK